MRMALGPHRIRLVSARRGRGKRITKPPRKPCRKPCPPPHPFQIPTQRVFSPICDRGLQPCVIVASPIYAPVRDIRGVAPPRARPAFATPLSAKMRACGAPRICLIFEQIEKGGSHPFSPSFRQCSLPRTRVRLQNPRTHAKDQAAQAHPPHRDVKRDPQTEKEKRMHAPTCGVGRRPGEYRWKNECLLVLWFIRLCRIRTIRTGSRQPPWYPPSSLLSPSLPPSLPVSHPPGTTCSSCSSLDATKSAALDACALVLAPAATTAYTSPRLR